MVFETGLPTRYYLDPTNVRFAHLAASPTQTQCPYKGETGGYWSAHANGTDVPDVAWTYLFTTPAMTPIAGLVAFLNEKVDVFDRRPARAAPGDPLLLTARRAGVRPSAPAVTAKPLPTTGTSRRQRS